MVSGLPVDITSLSPDRWYRNGDSGEFFNGKWEIPDYTNLNYPSRYSYHFDGTDDCINIGYDLPDLKPTGAISVIAWVKFEYVHNTNQGIVQCGADNG